MSKEEGVVISPKEQLEEVKLKLAEAKGAFRKFKKENSIRVLEKIKDEDLKETFLEHQKGIEELVKVKNALMETVKETKGPRGGGETYSYGQITDLETHENRDLTKGEKKKWRAHARKVAAKTEGVSGAQVPFDPDFFKPRVKKDKPKKEAEKETSEEKSTETPTPKARKKRVKK